MERPIVSVIIPVYNVSEYIEKAVDSICSQSLTDWEMFLVDDGSTDGSGDICDSLAFADSRIRVIHQENQGAAAARNLGIEKSSGKYLYFMDGDDWASSEMLYDMVCLAEHYYLDAWAGVPVNNRGRDLDSIGKAVADPAQFLADEPEEHCAQLVITGFYIETYSSDTDYYIQKQSVRSRVYGDKSEFRYKAHELFDKNLLYTPWNKLYLASYIKDNDIRFVQKHWDDFPFNLDVIRHAQRVCVTDNAYYHFIRKRADSESEKYNVALYDEREEEHNWLINLYEEWRREEVEKQLARIKENPETTHFLEEPDEPELLTGSVGYITVESGEKADDAEKKDPAKADITINQESEKPVINADQVVDMELASQTIAQEAKQTPEQDAQAAQDANKANASLEDVTATKAQDDQKSENAEHNPVADLSESEMDVLEKQEEGVSTSSEETISNNQEPQLPATEVAQGLQMNFPPKEAQEFIARRYIERIVGCVENVANPASGLSAKEKKAQIKEIIKKDTVKQALKVAKPKSLHMKAMLLPIRMRSAGLTYLEGKFISKVKSDHVKMFAKLKSNR